MYKQSCIRVIIDGRMVMDVNIFIACCGLDCEKCEARLATINNDDKLKKKVAEEWSKLNGIEITAEMINCEGCRVNGVKTVYCEALCPIRKCAMEKHFATCAECSEMNVCDELSAIISNNKEARDNLQSMYLGR